MLMLAYGNQTSAKSLRNRTAFTLSCRETYLDHSDLLLFQRGVRPSARALHVVGAAGAAAVPPDPVPVAREVRFLGFPPGLRFEIIRK